MSPSLANRLRIGFAIAFAVLTAMAVIGVGRFIQQRQDFENSIARSYQAEMAARVQLAQGEHPAAARAAIAAQAGTREQLHNNISGDTRDTALLVAAGLIAGLTGALLLFSGLIASMRRPLEELVEAAGRLAEGDLGPGRRSAASRRRRPWAPPSTRWPTSWSARPANATSSTGSRTSSSSPPRTSCAARSPRYRGSPSC